MKRREEIMQEANTRYSVSHPFIDIAKDSFIEGAKWADETMIKKACEYLESSLKHDLGYYGAADFANTFRKTMEE